MPPAPSRHPFGGGWSRQAGFGFLGGDLSCAWRFRFGLPAVFPAAAPHPFANLPLRTAPSGPRLPPRPGRELSFHPWLAPEGLPVAPSTGRSTGPCRLRAARAHLRFSRPARKPLQVCFPMLLRASPPHLEFGFALCFRVLTLKLPVNSALPTSVRLRPLPESRKVARTDLSTGCHLGSG